MNYSDLKHKVELEVKADRISRVIYELNGKYYSCLASKFSGKPLIKIDNEDFKTAKTKDKSKAKAVHYMQGTASKEVLSDNGNTGSEIPTENEQNS